MTIDPENFEPQGKPTWDQMREVYMTIGQPTVEKLHETLVGRGYQISRSSVGRAVQHNFVRPRPRKQLVKPAVAQLNEIVKEEVTVDIAMNVVGTPLTEQEILDVKEEIKQLNQMSDADLKALRIKENLIYNIMLLRYSQRKVEALALIPKDSAVMVGAMTEAAASMPELAASKLPQTNGNGAMIDVTPNEQNEVAAAISAFRKRESVAA